MAEQRFHTGSHDLPVSAALDEFMRTGWLDSEHHDLPRAEVAGWTPARRAALHRAFPGHRLVVPAGTFKARSNDQDYRFRPHSAYVWLTGDQSSDGVVVVEPDGDAVLYLRPRSARDNGEFFRDRRYGELWAGRRPTLGESTRALGVPTRHRDELLAALKPDTPTLVLRGLDAEVDTAVAPSSGDAELKAVLAELRLVKDAWEIAQLEEAVAITTRGFEDVVRALPQAKATSERLLEGVFWQRARLEGNEVGYHSIVAAGAHAATLHWIDNDGPVRDGDLLLLDAGAETRSLYTADITRVVPISGHFTPLQRDLYELCRKANDASLAALVPGAAYRDFHRAAMRVYAYGLADLGILPVSAEEALDEESGLYRRWTLCGSGHMLGLDVHDCAASRAENYLDGTLTPGHVLTVEPGIYFQPDDGLIPAELRGMGFRIEEDLLITETGYRMLSDGLPRTASDVESWMHRLAS
ncbi:aminopeptidase P family protein [Catellatospora bangladeshensis]|uniref:Xaa-Pro aminopeptidase n=1 Tax=Catellatospora bangladeshensis TaxID=310355 RepID=A0A8J3JCL9_9ACTN|nr:aminopeptidase P family protein [Catellatospora bangladeshensis]GIF80204.1 Xaa-Pro aminopeptidase 1 [Catellatospora bangladeshensis]